MDKDNDQSTLYVEDNDVPVEEKSESLFPISVDQSKQDKALAALVEEEDPEKIKDLTQIFNLYQTKRNAVRISALNDVQDALVKQMLDRLQKYPDNFANKDIAEWLKTAQGIMDSSNARVEQLYNTPTIVHQQNQVNVVNIVDSMSRESREKVLDVVETILKNAQNGTNDSVYIEDNNDDVIDVTDEEVSADSVAENNDNIDGEDDSNT